MLKKYIRKPYIFIPQCPCCQSWQTGYYVKKDKLDPDYHVRQAFKNGELVLAIDEIPHENAFCLACGFTWPQNIKVRMFSLLDVNEQKNLRNTAEIFSNMDLEERTRLGKYL